MPSPTPDKIGSTDQNEYRRTPVFDAFCHTPRGASRLSTIPTSILSPKIGIS